MEVSPFDVRCPEGSALVGIGIRSGVDVDGIRKIYCAKVEPVWDREPTMETRSIEIELPQTDTEGSRPATPARDLRMIPRIQPVPQYTPQEVPQRRSEEPSVLQRIPEEE